MSNDVEVEAGEEHLAWFNPRRLMRGFRGALDQMLIEADPSHLPPRLLPASPPLPTAPELSEMQSDRPIESAKEDLFRRSPFARRAADVLVRRADSASIIVGIFGPWGDGKTSTLAMMKETLRANSDVIIIEYNPWFFEGTTEALTRSFFKTIGATLEKSPLFSREKIGRALENYAEAVPKFGKPLANLGKALATEQLTEIRDKIGNILRKSGKRVVIFIDDIDRLDRREIQTLFKLVRLSGDFEYTSYVLAFDEVMVAEALSDAYGGHEGAGARFLEKIIQVPLHLPPADRQILRSLAFASCDRVLEQNEISLSRDGGTELGNAFVMGFTPVLKTPRQAKLFDNAITFAIPLLKNEANPIDQILIEGIRVFYPTLYALIRDNSSMFLKGASRHDEEKGPDKITRIRAVLESVGLSPTEIDGVLHHLLEKLFPRLQRSEFGRDFEQEWGAEKRVCSSDYFARYFNYGVPARDVSDHSVETLIAAATEAGDAFAAALIEFKSAGTIPLLLTKLRQRQEKIPEASIPGLVTGLVVLVNELPYVESLLGFSQHDEAALLIAGLIERADEEQRDNLVSVLTTGSKDPGFAFQTLRWMLASPDESKRGFMTETAHQKAVDFVVERWLEEHGGNVAKGLPTHATAPFLGYIRVYASEPTKDRVRRTFSEALENDSTIATSLIRAFTPIATNLANGVKSVSDFRSDAYESMGELIDLDQLYSQLVGRYGKLVENPEYGSRYDSESNDDDVVDQRLARQFSFVHLSAKDEARENAATGPGKQSGEADADQATPSE